MSAPLAWKPSRSTSAEIVGLAVIVRCSMCDGRGTQPLPPDPRATTLPPLPHNACHTCRGQGALHSVVTLADFAIALRPS